MNLAEYANIILRNEPEKVYKTLELKTKFETIAHNIFECPRRNSRNRSYEEVFGNVEKTALEHALAQRAGFEMPDWTEWDPSDDHYDLKDPNTGATFECKNFSANWLSYYPKAVQTMRNNIAKLDYVVAGTVRSMPELYLVDFRLVILAKKFFEYDCPPMSGKKRFFQHFLAEKNQHCVFARRP